MSKAYRYDCGRGKERSVIFLSERHFAERFQRPIEVRVLYEEAKDSKLKYNDMKLKQEVNAILDHAEAMQAEKGVSEKQEDKKESKAGKRKFLPEKKREAFRLMEKGKETIILRSNATRTIQILCTDVISMIIRSNFEQSSVRW